MHKILMFWWFVRTFRYSYESVTTKKLEISQWKFINEWQTHCKYVNNIKINNSTKNNLKSTSKCYKKINIGK